MSVKWLSHWLSLPSIDYSTKHVEIDGKSYWLVQQFRVAFFIHCVFFDLSTEEYIWYIVVNHTLVIDDFHRAKRYQTHSEMLQDVSSHFTIYSSPSFYRRMD